MEKAYDRVNWDFPFYLLGSCGGFGRRWCKWIKHCISMVRFLVLVNGSPMGFFNSSRGLRQRDPLSHFLFLIVTDSLSRMLGAVIDSGFLAGF